MTRNGGALRVRMCMLDGCDIAIMRGRTGDVSTGLAVGRTSTRRMYVYVVEAATVYARWCVRRYVACAHTSTVYEHSTSTTAGTVVGE